MDGAHAVLHSSLPDSDGIGLGVCGSYYGDVTFWYIFTCFFLLFLSHTFNRAGLLGR